MKLVFRFVAMALIVGCATAASAQQGLGGLRGIITDAQGAVLPGVTVTVTSPTMLGPQVGVTNAQGEYRVLNLPPGTFTLTAELTGFATFERPGILLRAGATFQVDVLMQLSTLQETITVTADSPMIEVDKASNVLNIDGEFQRLMPIQARRNYSDFLELTPGVISRGFDDGSGRQVYFGHATEHFAHVLQLEGTIASNYHDAQLTYVSMGADMVADTQVKTGGVDAAEPMGVGLVMNIITKSGGNSFRGSGAGAYQPYNWNGSNVDNCTTAPGCKPGSGGTPTTAYVRQFDGALGGPIARDKAWFFAALRRSLSSSGISRTSAEVDRIQAFKPGTSLFDNDSESWQPFVKVTTRAGRHDLQAFYQRDRLVLTGDREYNYESIQAQSTGGPLYSGKVTSVWGGSVTTTLTASYNGKGGSDADTFTQLGLTGPQIVIHNNATVSGATLQGTGRILEGGNLQSYAYQPASQVIIRADLTYFKDGWFGNHQFQTGIFAAPRNRYDQQTNYVNDGFVLEEQRLRDLNNIGAGTIPFHRRYITPTTLTTRQARDRDIGIYLQDSWRPNGRLSINAGRARRLREALRRRVQDHAPAEHRDRAALRLLVPADQGRPHRPARQRRARARTGDGPRRHHALRRLRGRRPARRVRLRRRRHASRAWWPHRRARRRSPTTSSPTASTSPTSTSSSSDCGASFRARSAWISPASAAPTRTTGRGSTSTASTRAARISRSAASAPSIRTAASSSSSRTTSGARSITGRWK